MRCGAAIVDITPGRRVPLAGNGPSGGMSRGVARPLHARAVVLESDEGVRLAWVVADLMSATRPLVERASALVLRDTGLPARALLLSGTHTHHGPGGIYGNTLYDTLASSTPGHDHDLVEALAEQIASAVVQAHRSLRPASLGWAEAPLWGVFRNASLSPFLSNPESSRWHDAGHPGHGVPDGLSEVRRAVDPRVRVLVASDRHGHPLTVMANVAAHATCLGHDFDQLHPDWPGHAVDHASRLLSSPGRRVAVSVAVGAAGDINVLHDTEPQGPSLARRRGELVGEAIARAAHEALQGTRQGPVSLSTRRLSSPVSDRIVSSDTSTELSDGWVFGAPALAGAEDGRSPLHALGLAREGMRSRVFSPGDPQHPKSPALGALQGALRTLLGLEAPTTLPLSVLQIGDVSLIGVPFEPSVMAGFRIERALLTHTGSRAVWVVGYAGDYAGYLTTAEEYAHQHYEGASMLWGRNTLDHVIARLLSQR